MTQVMTKIRKIMGPTTQSPQNNKKINKEDTTKQWFPPTKIKPDITIEQKLRENSPCEKVKVLSCAGKATGKYSNCWNSKNHNKFKQPIETPASSDTQSNKNHEMEIIDQLSNLSIKEHHIQTHEPLLVQNKEEALEVKLK